MIAELHTHSNHSSDGIDPVRKILFSAIEKGLDAISITDHNTVNGSLEAEEIVRDEHLSILIIPGTEISTKDGHLLAYGVRRDFEPKMDMSETAREVRASGGITAIAHPFQFQRSGIVRIKKAIYDVDAIEVFNAKFYIGLCNKLAQYIARKHKKPSIAGSDAHSSSAVGYGTTEIYNAKDVDTALTGIQRGNTKVIGKRIPIALQLKFSARRIPGVVNWK